MVQAKHKKSNPKKKQQRQGDVKKHGKQGGVGQFHSQLDCLGLKIIQVTADGNCFYRALADQLKGNEEEHEKYRRMVVQYIMNHREDFEAFIEDDVPFEEYCQSMEKDGTWAGHMELQAASLVTKRNICIHRIMSPRWYIQNFSGHEASMIHLSYHDGEHYNSVRLKEDSCEGPAMRIVIKILQEVHDDVDAAIEFLLAEQEMIEEDNYNDDISCECNGDNPKGNCEQPVVASRDMTCEPSVSSSSIQAVKVLKDHSSQQDNKKIARNKECSCGSRKKYKDCCGSAVGKFSAPVINSKGAASKGRKEPKPNRKKEAIREAPERGPGNVPDLGALCI